MIRSAFRPLLLLLGLSLVAAAQEKFTPGARVIVDKAGAGHRAIILRIDGQRLFVAYEGADERFDEWIDAAIARPVRPPAPVADSPTGDAAAKAAPAGPEVPPGGIPPPEPLPPGIEIPRPRLDAVVADAWLERLPRNDPAEPVKFNTARLALPLFRFGAVAGIPSGVPPQRAVLLQGADGRVAGFAAIEDGIALYRRDERAGLVRAGVLDLTSLAGYAPEFLEAGDLNGDGVSDLVVAGGPVVQVFFGSAAGTFRPSAAPYRARSQVRGVAPGKFFIGALPWGVALVEDFNAFRLVAWTEAGAAPAGESYRVKFQRITRIVAGDFDGDGYSDIAIATDNHERSTGAWMYFNQRGVPQPFLWPIGGSGDFARDLHVADLDRDGRADLILTDSDTSRGERVRVVFGAAGRAGWEDPWDVISGEYGIGLGTASIVTGDFNHDGRLDLGIGGRNGVRLYLGADFRRFARNPVWPRLEAGTDFPEQSVFLAGDFGEDGVTDLLGFTPAFATGYNLLYGATPAAVAGVAVPGPLRPRAVAQAGGTTNAVSRAPVDLAPGETRIEFLGSRAEPYGPYRYRVVVEVAIFSARVVQAVEAVCAYAGQDLPRQEVRADSTRQGERQWFIEVTLPRVRDYTFSITATDDSGRQTEALRVVVNP